MNGGKGLTVNETALCKTPYSYCSRMYSLFSPAIVLFCNRYVNALVHICTHIHTTAFQQNSGRLFSDPCPVIIWLLGLMYLGSEQRCFCRTTVAIESSNKHRTLHDSLFSECDICQKAFLLESLGTL